MKGVRKFMQQDGGLSIVPLNIFSHIVELYVTLFFGLITMFIQPGRRPVTNNGGIMVVDGDGQLISGPQIVRVVSGWNNI